MARSQLRRVHRPAVPTEAVQRAAEERSLRYFARVCQQFRACWATYHEEWQGEGGYGLGTVETFAHDCIYIAKRRVPQCPVARELRQDSTGAALG